MASLIVNDIVSSKIIVSNNNLINNLCDIPDVKKDNFSFRDIANDVLYLKNKIFNNPILKKYFDQNETNPSPSSIGNVVLRNICRNFCNDPNSPPPPNYIKRVSLITSNNTVMVDSHTYRNDGGPVHDVNVCVADLELNVSIKKSTFNPLILDLSNFNKLTFGHQHYSVLCKREYEYPAEELDETMLVSNNVETHEILDFILNSENSKEVIQAICKNWGWATRRSKYYHHPGYHVAHNVEFPSGYSFIIKVSYIKYKDPLNQLPVLGPKN